MNLCMYVTLLLGQNKLHLRLFVLHTHGNVLILLLGTLYLYSFSSARPLYSNYQNYELLTKHPETHIVSSQQI